MAHILLVDDEPLVAESLSLAMTSIGHTVVAARNGVEAMQRVLEENVDLVVTDIVMPSKDGIEVIMEMRRARPDISVIAISGGGRHGTSDFLKMASGLGAFATLKKPIHLAEFVETLNRSLSV